MVRVALDDVFPSVQERLRVRLLLNVQPGGPSVEEPVVRPSLGKHSLFGFLKPANPASDHTIFLYEREKYATKTWTI